MSGKSVLVLLFIAGVFALVYGISIRLSAEAINVIAGVVCGVAASVPVSVGLLIALTRERYAEDYEDPSVSDRDSARSAMPSYPPAPPQSYPPIIVMAPPQGQISNPYQFPPNALPPGFSMNEPPRLRDFKIIGEDDDESVDM